MKLLAALEFLLAMAAIGLFADAGFAIAAVFVLHGYLGLKPGAPSAVG